ncbi:MAG TPA: type II secretion system protein [Chthoniobacterales bacterium]|nr:type II secretion system protein [Chthoniobacterales bacterium]
MNFGFGGKAAFTLIELLVVIAVIIILAGLILSTVGYVQKKGARSRAEAEIAAISAALESYKADNGIYPRDSQSDSLDARTNLYPYGADAARYELASQTLYVALTGDTNRNRQIDPGETGKTYFSFKPNMLSPTDGTATVTGIRDPFGYSYGYSTAFQSDPTKGYNPTFDLWSTSGRKEQTDTDQSYVARWTKNW